MLPLNVGISAQKDPQGSESDIRIGRGAPFASLIRFDPLHTVTYLPYSIHLGKKTNVQSHSKVRSPLNEVYKCV